MGGEYLAKRYQKSGSADEVSKLIAYAKLTEGVIDLSVGDPDVPTPEPITRHAFQEVLSGNDYTRYSPLHGYGDLLDAVAGHYESAYGVRYDRDEIFASAGANFVLYAILQAILDEGDEVILPTPYFFVYKGQLDLCGGVLVPLPTYAEDGFLPDPKLLKALITPRTKCILLNSPCNPTGAVIDPETIREIVRIAAERDILILSDEVYESFCFQERFTHVGSLYRDKTITVGSFSKSFAMTGWRIGYVIAPVPVIGAIQSFCEYTTYSAPSPSQRAALYAARHFDELAPQVASVYRNRLAYAHDRLRRMPLVETHRPQGSIYLFPSIAKSGLSSLEFCRRLVQEKQVAMLPGDIFGPGGEGYVRIAATVTDKKFELAMDRLEAFMKEFL